MQKMCLVLFCSVGTVHTVHMFLVDSWDRNHICRIARIMKMLLQVSSDKHKELLPILKKHNKWLKMKNQKPPKRSWMELQLRWKEASGSKSQWSPKFPHKLQPWSSSSYFHQYLEGDPQKLDIYQHLELGSLSTIFITDTFFSCTVKQGILNQDKIVSLRNLVKTKFINLSWLIHIYISNIVLLVFIELFIYHQSMFPFFMFELV